MRSAHAEGGREERQRLLVGRLEDSERLRARQALVRQGLVGERVPARGLDHHHRGIIPEAERVVRIRLIGTGSCPIIARRPSLTGRHDHWMESSERVKAAD